MAINPDAAFSRGDIMRRLADHDREIAALRTARRLESASIGEGGIRVLNGFIVILDAQGNEQMRLSSDGLSMEGLLQVIGEILVQGGGDITVDDGGSFEALDGSQIRARYADGSTAVLWGSLVTQPGDEPLGHGLSVEDDLAGDKQDIFRSYRALDGSLFVFVGSTDQISGDPRPIDQFIVRSNLTRVLGYGATEDTFLSALGGGDSVVAADGGGDAELRAFGGGDARVSVIDTGGDVRLTNPDFRVFTAFEATGNAANCHLTADGQIMRNASSRRFKKDIRNAEIDADAVLRLQPRTWLPADEMTGYSAETPASKRKNGSSEGRASAKPKKKRAQPSRPQIRQVGFVAEELDDIGLSQFVEHDEDGQAGGIAYDRLTAALVTLCQRQQEQIDALTAWAVTQGFEPPDQG